MSPRRAWQLVVSLAIGVAAAACYEPAFQPCTISCTTACPAGLECIAGQCATPGGSCELEGTARRTAGGAHHACGIVGGELYCWGSNAAGQLAQPLPAAGTDPSLPPGRVATPAAGAWISVAAGAAHTCAVLSPTTGADEIYCWGEDADLQLGDVPDTTAFVRVTRPGGDRVAGLAVGARHGCAILEDATTARRIACWGDNEVDQLGTVSAQDQATPVVVADLPSGERWSSIDAGDRHTCVLADSGALWCWGSDAQGQLGRPGTARAPGQVPGAWRLITAGGDHTCAVASAGGLLCWGDNTGGLLGTATLDPIVEEPVAVDALGASATWDSLDAGPRATCGTVGGAVYCWGIEHPQAGLVTLASGQATPVDPVQGIAGSAAAEVALTEAAACALVDTGDAVEIRCWGDSPFGELGDGTRTIAWAPVQVTSVMASAWRQVRAGADRTCAVYENGMLFATECWGQNAFGQTAPGSSADHVASPAPLDQQGLVQSWVGVGRAHTCVLRRTVGVDVRCYGDDSLSQRAGVAAGQAFAANVGTNATITADLDATCVTGDLTGIPNCWGSLDPTHQLATPTPLMNGIRLRPQTVLWGFQSGCGVDPAGGLNRVKCYGTEDRGELGDGGATADGTYFAPADTSVVGVVTSHGPAQTRCLWNGFDVFCWGDNRRRQAAPGMALEAIGAPANVMAGTNVAELATGGGHTCMIADGGELTCWGAFDRGQRASATSVDPAPIPPIDGNDWTSVSAGGDHTCAIDVIGRLYCWGRNTFGQIGNGQSARASASPIALP
jgi:alpha-tubulin suppressor-like RCC1 family protein